MSASSFSQKIWLIIFSFLLFFLPYLEGDLRTFGYIFLLLSSGLIGLTSKWKNTNFDLIELFFLLFLVIASLSTIFSDGKTRSFLEVLRYLSYFLIFLSIRRLDIYVWNKLKTVYIFSVIVNSLLLSIVSWTYFLPKKIFPLPSSGMNLYYPVFGHNRLADLLLFSLPVSFFLMIHFKNTKKIVYKLLVGLFFFLSVTFSFTFSKSGYLVLVFVTVVIANYLDIKKINIGYICKLLLIIVIPVFLFFSFVFINTYFLKIKERSIYSNINKALYLDWRWDYYSIAVNSLKKDPFIGVGLDNFRYLSRLYQSKPYSSSDYGENYYFTLFAETGLLGGPFFLLLLSQIYKKLKCKTVNSDDFLSLGIFFALISSAMHTFFSVDWYFLSIFLYFWVGTALIIPPINKIEISNRFCDLITKRMFPMTLIIFSIIYLFGTILTNLFKNSVPDNLTSLVSILTMFDQKNQIKIGEAYLKRNNPDKALYFYERAKRLEPKDSYSYLLIANIDETQEKWDEAVTNYLEAISLVPLDLSQYHLKVYKIYLIKMQKEVANKDLDKAMLYFKLTLDGFPSYQKKVDGMKLYNQTVKLIKQNKKEEVVSVLKKYIKEGQKLKGNLGVTREEILRTVDLLRNNLIN